MRFKSIADELENREVPLCAVCKENPKRENLKTCSPECARKKVYDKIYYRKYYQKNKKQMRLLGLKYAHSIKGKKAREKYRKKNRVELNKKRLIYQKSLYILKNNHKEEFIKIHEKLKKSVKV